MNRSSEIREFLISRRARITPQQAGLVAYGANRRVEGLRREEVAMLAGVSVDYYTRLERGHLAGASESVLDSQVPMDFGPFMRNITLTGGVARHALASASCCPTSSAAASSRPGIRHHRRP